jgi:hypothetical protein
VPATRSRLKSNGPRRFCGELGRVFASVLLPGQVLRRLTHDFDRRNIFRKVQSYHAVAILFLTSSDPNVKAAADEFLRANKEGNLPLFNQGGMCLASF